MIFLPHTNTVILLEPYCGTITEPGLPVVGLQNFVVVKSLDPALGHCEKRLASRKLL